MSQRRDRELVERARKKSMAEWTEDEREAVKRALDCDDAMDDGLDMLGDEDLDAPPARPCADCGRPFDDDAKDAPMLHDGSWRKLARKDELVCDKCFHARVGRLSIKITLADLRPCRFNVFAGWFEAYADQAAPEMVEDWLKWARRAEESYEAREAQYRKASDRIFADGKPNPEGRLVRVYRKTFKRHGG